MLESRSSKDEQVELIKVLQGVTEGKIFVEIDRARLTKRLAGILEGENKIKEAADAMQEVAVETFGAMHRSEKIAYVLEQMRLCMDNNDFIRAQILSRKVLSQHCQLCVCSRDCSRSLHACMSPNQPRDAVYTSTVRKKSIYRPRCVSTVTERVRSPEGTHALSLIHISEPTRPY